MTTALWVLAVLMIVVGIAGTVLPALPGVALIFAGTLLAAWIDGFAQIGLWTISLLATLTVIALVIDFAASALLARRAGATAYGVVGAGIGTIVGVFTGLIGLILMPLAGAFVGEFIARRDALRAGRVGVATWVGLVIAAVSKVAIAFMMVGIFAVALFF